LKRDVGTGSGGSGPLGFGAGAGAAAATSRPFFLASFLSRLASFSAASFAATLARVASSLAFFASALDLASSPWIWAIEVPPFDGDVSSHGATVGPAFFRPSSCCSLTLAVSASSLAFARAASNLDLLSCARGGGGGGLD
jgi:hypothetical protein